MITLNKRNGKFIRFDPDKGNLYALKITEVENKELEDDIKNLKDEDFKTKYRINKSNIALFGDILSADKNVFEFVCDFKISPDGKNVYRCFGNDSLFIYSNTKINLHENPESSWNCFIEYMYYPTHVVLYYIL